MVNKLALAAASSAALGVLLSSAAFAGGDGVAVRVVNDGTEDVIVTVYDASTSPPRSVLAGERINGFTVVPIQVLAGSDGRARVSWTAVSADPTARKCGKARDVEVSDSAQLSVSASDNC